jgi:uncharacterized protein YecE (DUF72 family)
MKLFIGASGYSYPKWKGKFYPEKFPENKMFEYYSQNFSSVEINATYYRLPDKKVFESWEQQAPENFKYALKAPQQITHFKRLKDAETELESFINNSKILNKKRGPLLFQLPPNFKKDIDLLKKFIKNIHESFITFEFRHSSWNDADVFKVLSEKNFSLCIADTDENLIEEIISTADWGYLRLRKKEYSPKDLAAWKEKFISQNWKEVYIYFKHEDEANGPKFAKILINLFKK